MPDITWKRNTALNQLLAEFDRPPPVPPKDHHQNQPLAKSGIAETLATPALPNDLWACFGAATQDSNGQNHGAHAAATNFEASNERRPLRSMNSSIPAQEMKQEAPAVKTHVVTVQRKKVAFAQDEIRLSPPPVSLQKDSFEKQIGVFQLDSTASVFDPPLAPRFSRFPEQLPEVPKRKPAPLNLKRPTSQTGKWKVRTESEIWTPIDDEPDTASIRSMDAHNAPRLCPLPYKPVKSIPLRSRGSLRPAPLRIRKGVRFDSVKSPANLPLKSPALLGKKVRFGSAKSPAIPMFRAPSTPHHSAYFAIPSPRARMKVRFAAVKSPATSSFKTPPTPFYQSKFRRSAPKRNVRFDDIKSPATSMFKTPSTPYYNDTFDLHDSEKAVRFAQIQSPATSTFKTPPTPYYNDSFGSQDPDKEVRFAQIQSPAVSTFRNPPTPYTRVSFEEPTTPLDTSPITPRTLHITVPAIEPDSPLQSPPAIGIRALDLNENWEPKRSSPGMRSASKAKAMQFPPRTTSLSHHRRNLSLPQEMKTHQENEPTTLPATTFDENAVGESTLRWLGMLPKPSYRVSKENTVSDRNQILGSYFHRPTPSA